MVFHVKGKMASILQTVATKTLKILFCCFFSANSIYPDRHRIDPMEVNAEIP